MVLSIIIPVYKVEDYVGHCLRSILEAGGASPDHYEVIVVNDGTTDCSMTVVRDVCRGHGNVIIIEQENQGLSAARMAGLARANGDYVWFVDSDDWLEDGGVQLILNYLNNCCDTPVLMIPLHWRYDDVSLNHTDILLSASQHFKGNDVLRKEMFPISAAQRYITKRSLFSDSFIRFPIGLIHEDEYFGRALLYQAKSVFVLSESPYCYRQRIGSIMNSRSARSAYDILEIYDLLLEYMRQRVLPTDYNWFHKQAFNLIQYGYTQLAISNDPIEFRRFKKKQLSFIMSEYNKTHREVSNWTMFVEKAILRFPRLYAYLSPIYLSLKNK